MKVQRALCVLTILSGSLSFSGAVLAQETANSTTTLDIQGAMKFSQVEKAMVGKRLPSVEKQENLIEESIEKNNLIPKRMDTKTIVESLVEEPGKQPETLTSSSEKSTQESTEEETTSTETGESIKETETSAETTSSSVDQFSKNDNGETTNQTDTAKEGASSGTNDSSETVAGEIKETLKQEKTVENGWTYVPLNGYAYITKCDLSGDIVVPDTLGGMPTRFWDMNHSVFINYENITSLVRKTEFYADSLNLKQFKSLKSVDLNLVILNPVSAKEMFSGCSKLESINLYDFDTSKITDMESMFYNCASLKSIDVSKWDTSNVTNMKAMFRGCRNLQSVDLSNFNTANVVNMSQMFDDCNNLTSVDLSSFDTSNVTDMSSMFSYCSNLQSIDLSNFNIANVVDMGRMFAYTNFNTLKISGKPANGASLAHMFWKCSTNNILDLSRFDTSSVTNMAGMFRNLSAPDLKISGKFNTSNVTNMDNMFNSIRVPNIDLSNFDTSNVTSMSNMFVGINVNLDVSGFNTSNVVNMSRMFALVSISTLDLSSFDTSKVTNMSEMFYSSSNLNKLNLSNFNTSNVTDMNNMFSDCDNLTSVDLSNFNTSNVTDMSYMFYACNKLTSLDLSSFTTPKIQRMSGMFYSCSKLTFIDLSNVDTSNVIHQANDFINSYTNKKFLAIKTNDSNLLNLDYAPINRIPYGPSFNANGGLFEDGVTTERSYFSKVAMEPSEYDSKIRISTLKEYAKDNVPHRDGYIFSGWEDARGNTIDQVANVLDQIGNVYYAKWQTDPNAPDGSTPPDNINPQSKLGIAYRPTTLSINKTKLNTSGEQSIPVAQTTGLHVGVKDYAASTAWRLTAQLKWDTKGLTGSYIKGDNNGNVQKNENNGNQPVTSADLKDTSEVIGEAAPKINESETIIMRATKDQRRGVYDYSLGKANLVIPQTKYIQPDKYSGTIQWNLVVAP
ncbi:BspA family leucine-rich repeat surface protein [Enterococcus faecium]|uniref:BspA family leucine-rich repeat surface protein n=1 Tax=Enterococcus faecium TaxID=1352 RepID=UPI003979F710